MVGFFEAVYTGIQGDWTGRGVEWDGWGGKGWHPQAAQPDTHQLPQVGRWRSHRFLLWERE